MGSTTITRYEATGKPLENAWQDLWENERFEHGSDPYSGSFATCQGIIDVSDQPLALIDAQLVAGQLLTGEPLSDRFQHVIRPVTFSKWGDAGAIKVLDTTDARIRQKTVTVKHTRAGHLTDAALLELARTKLTIPTGAHIDNPQLVDDKITSKTIITRATGSLQTVYRLSGQGTRGEEYADQRSAIDAAKTISAKRLAYGMPDTTITIETIRRRADGPTTVSTIVTGRTSRITVDIVTPTDPRRTSGYLFFAWAAC